MGITKNNHFTQDKDQNTYDMYNIKIFIIYILNLFELTIVKIKLKAINTITTYFR